MNIMSHNICLLCRAVKPATFQALANITLSNTTRNKIFQSYSQQPSILSCASLIQSRCMSSKFKKDDRNVHRKDAACIGEGDRMYEPQSPYREPWPKHYGWENKLFGGGALPKLDKPMKFKPVKKQKDDWDREHALFGQNDYIDILGDGNVRPVDLMRGPSWLRGFRGNEMQRIIRQLKFQGATIRQLYPTKYHDMEKRLDYLFKHYNIRRSKRIGKGVKRVQK